MGLKHGTRNAWAGTRWGRAGWSPNRTHSYTASCTCAPALPTTRKRTPAKDGANSRVRERKGRRSRLPWRRDRCASHLPRATRHGIDAVVLVREKDVEVAALKGVRSELARRLERSERAAFKFGRVREHDVHCDEGAVIIVTLDGQAARAKHRVVLGAAQRHLTPLVVKDSPAVLGVDPLCCRPQLGVEFWKKVLQVVVEEDCPPTAIL